MRLCGPDADEPFAGLHHPISIIELAQDVADLGPGAVAR
jgi:hypothetical protein